MKMIFAWFCAFCFVLTIFAKDAEQIECEIDKIDHLTSANALLTGYTNIIDRFGSNELLHISYDGANGLFVAYAGLARACWWAAGPANMLTGLVYALHARTLGYTTGTVASNPKRFADNLHFVSLFDEALSLPDEMEQHSEEAWQIWPYFNGDMLNVWRRRQANNHYEPIKGIPVTLEVVDHAPFVNTLFYRNCGWFYTLNEDYRGAFAMWFRGLKDGEPHFWNSPTPERIIEYIEYATLDELNETKRLFLLNAAKYPAVMASFPDISGWFTWANNAHLALELRLRQAEQAGEIGTVTTLLARAVLDYRRPLYAQKLGDTNLLIRLYCDRMKEQTWWWTDARWSLVPRIQVALPCADANSAAMLSETLRYLRATYSNSPSVKVQRSLGLFNEQGSPGNKTALP